MHHIQNGTGDMQDVESENRGRPKPAKLCLLIRLLSLIFDAFNERKPEQMINTSDNNMIPPPPFL